MTAVLHLGLEQSLTLWEWVDYLGTAVVFLGVVGESLAEFLEIPKKTETRETSKRASALLLIIGLAVELLGLVMTTQISGQIIAQVKERTATIERENLKLRADLQDVFIHQQPRHLDCTSFLRMLEGKPATARVWYERNDDEAFGLAEQIYECFDRDRAVEGLQWKVSKPEPIPEHGGDPKLPNAPGAVRFGPGFGIGLVSNESIPSPDFNSSLGALSNALSIALNAGVTRSTDSSLPKNVFVIVVGQKM